MGEAAKQLDLFSVPQLPVEAKTVPMIQDRDPVFMRYLEQSLCPLCQQEVRKSEYLGEHIQDPRVLWLANLITHYRHSHVQWDRSWKYMQRQHGDNWNYEKAKSEFNNRAKRQYIRKAHLIFKHCGITAADFAELQNTDRETILLANKYL
jgi:hypothetical protein